MIDEREKELILKMVEENAQKAIDKRVPDIKERGVREFLAFYSNTIGEPPLTLTMASIAFIKRLRGEE